MIGDENIRQIGRQRMFKVTVFYDSYFIYAAKFDRKSVKLKQKGSSRISFTLPENEPWSTVLHPLQAAQLFIRKTS